MIKVSPLLRQYLATGCCNLLTFSVGLSNGWGTINFVELQNENSGLPLGKLTLYEATLVVSILNIGGLFSIFVLLPMKRALGIKRLIHVLGIPMIMSILLIVWAHNVYLLYISRLLSGFVTGASSVVMRLLIAEVSSDEIRGTLNSIWNIAYSLGIAVSFLLGSYFDCVDQAKIHLIPLLVFAFIMLFLPESPEYHFEQNNEKAAIKSLKFYKGKATVNEREKFLENGTLDSKTAEKSAEDDKLTWSDFLTPEAKRSIFIAVVTMVLSLASGILIVLSYVTAIFAESGSNLSEKTSSILIIGIKLVASGVFLCIVESFGRRTLLISSCVLAAIAYFMFGIHCLFWKDVAGLEWIAPACFAAIIFSGLLGLTPIPYILTVEVFPKKIRNPCIIFSASMYFVLMFLAASAYPIIMAAVGLPACMFGFGVLSVTGAFVTFCFVPETRGKSYDEIMRMLRE